MKYTLFLIPFIFTVTKSFSQVSNENTIYVIDSIPIINEPSGDEDGEGSVKQEDIFGINVITNKDSLRKKSYEKFDKAIFVTTKEYEKRPYEIKIIPTTKKLLKKNGIYFFNNIPFNGQFIDYYYSGRKYDEGKLVNGRLVGTYIAYYQNGKVSVIRNYKNGIEYGTEKEFHEDGPQWR